MADSEHSTSRRLPEGNDVVRRTCYPTTDTHEEFIVERGSDQLPLEFGGTLLGMNVVDESLPRGTLVRVFVTRGGSYVTAVRQWQSRRGVLRERHAAAVHEDPAAALAWLVADGGGQLGRSSCEAWRQACAKWPALRELGVEKIE